LIGIIWKGKFKGQRQKWFVIRFVGNESEININTKHPEFLDWKWIDIDDLTKIAVYFKLEVYKQVKSEIEKILN
jgi:putative (di)nucleoside polyphosphate hydrolase